MTAEILLKCPSCGETHPVYLSNMPIIPIIEENERLRNEAVITSKICASLSEKLVSVKTTV
jgi:hypothetical protein